MYIVIVSHNKPTNTNTYAYGSDYDVANISISYSHSKHGNPNPLITTKILPHNYHRKHHVISSPDKHSVYWAVE